MIGFPRFTHRDDPAPPGAPAVAPAPAFHCTDRTHCRLAVLGAAAAAAPCPTVGVVTCPPLHLPGLVQPNSYNNTAHVPGPVQVCTDCVQDGLNEKRQIVNRRIGIGNIVAPPIPPAVQPPGTSLGARSDLCRKCVREEMILYWRRVGTPRPVPPAPNSMHWIWRWPTAAVGAASTQDLCRCMRRCVGNYSHTHCHACRDATFQYLRTQGAIGNEHILRTRKENVIQGRDRCTANGGVNPWTVPAATIANRQAHGIGRMCPCGRTPWIRPNAAPFIDVCLACMGVRINPANIPEDFQRHKLIRANPTRAEVAAGGPTFYPTKGKRKAARHPTFRVNIECGWMTNPVPPHAGDPYIGGQ